MCQVDQVCGQVCEQGANSAGNCIITASHSGLKLKLLFFQSMPVLENEVITGIKVLKLTVLRQSTVD